MTVADFVALTRRSWRTLLIFLAVGLAAATIATALMPRVYQSRSAGYVVAGYDGGLTDALGGSQAAISKARSYIPLITSGAVFGEIAENSELDLGGEPLVGRLSAAVAAESTLIEVTASASTPEGSVALANGALTALAVVVEDIEASASASQQAAITVVPLDNAVAPTRPVSPDWRLNLLLGGVASLVAGYLFVIVRRALDQRVRTTEQLTELLGVGVLGRIPKLDEEKGTSTGRAELGGLGSEAFRQLRTSLRFSSVDHEVRSVVVTSANQGEGKSTIAAALAKVLAESGEPTVIVDADLRRPSMPTLLGVDGSVGLSEVLSGQVVVADALRATNVSGLVVIPAGRTPPNPSEMIGSDAMRGLIDELAQEYFVIVDAPPLLPVTDAALASVIVDGVIFVAAAGLTRKPEVIAALRILEQVHPRLLGGVLNMVSVRRGEDSYHYNRRNRGYHARASANGGQPAPIEQLPRSAMRRSAR